ncbi:repeat, PH and SEC7 domain containing secG-like [Octopus vulgaris]|uniref:Repeat, PH and SEC7 domain containing secG-like n=1 Tax=Octopus vulgaris TaxID=6645 RepID=A0AA36C205_OCTVU|nr:repeat, PH and SEC7 domain containing secG-like [Octopus vulgaris]
MDKRRRGLWADQQEPEVADGSALENQCWTEDSDGPVGRDCPSNEASRETDSEGSVAEICDAGPAVFAEPGLVAEICDAVPKKSCDLEPVEVEVTKRPVEGVMADAVVPCLEPLASRPLSLGAQDEELARSGANVAESEVPALCVMVAADECCRELQLDMDRRLSGIVVLSYLASQGASLYHHNNKKMTPLDYIENQHLKEKLKTFLQSLCRWCQEKKATVTLHPCQHTVICQNCCSQMTFKQCPICRQHILRKSGFVCPKSEEEAAKAVAESVVCPKSEEKAAQAVVESVESLNLEENRFHSTSKKVAVKQQQVETPKLEEKCLQDVAKLLGVNWQQVGRNLGIRNVKLGNIRYDYPYNTEEQGFQMLHTWYTSCDPEMRTLKTLRKALEEAECFEALQCLPSEEK